jgi:hypothetical protein
VVVVTFTHPSVRLTCTKATVFRRQRRQSRLQPEIKMERKITGFLSDLTVVEEILVSRFLQEVSTGFRGRREPKNLFQCGIFFIPFPQNWPGE